MLHGAIWDDANEKAKELVRDRGLTYVHPFDDLQLIAGQGTLGLEVVRDWPEVDVIVVPIGGGGLISGVAMAAKAIKPSVKVIGVESSGAPGMRDSVRAGAVVTLDRVDCVIDGLRVKRVGETTFEVVRRMVDEIVTLPDERIFDAMLWIMSHAKLVVEGAAAAPGRGVAGRTAAGARRIERRLRAERRQRQPRSAPGIEVELNSRSNDPPRPERGQYRSVPVTVVGRPGRGTEGTTRDLAAVEEPLEVRLHGKPFAVIMRTPGEDRALAAGFLLSEGVVRTADDIGAIEHCRHPDRPDGHNVVDVYLLGASRSSLDTLLADRRKVLTNSSCGLCGRLTIDSLKTRASALPVTWVMSTSVAAGLPDSLRVRQRVFDGTGGLHAAGLFTRRRHLRSVGRRRRPPQRRRQGDRRDGARRSRCRSPRTRWP